MYDVPCRHNAYTFNLSQSNPPNFIFFMTKVAPTIYWRILKMQHTCWWLFYQIIIDQYINTLSKLDLYKSDASPCWRAIKTLIRPYQYFREKYVNMLLPVNFMSETRFAVFSTTGQAEVICWWPWLDQHVMTPPHELLYKDLENQKKSLIFNDRGSSIFGGYLVYLWSKVFNSNFSLKK